jgi:hypothetical protein
LASYSGVQNAAEIESSVYSPVSRWTMNEFGISSCFVCAQISGWLRLIQASFGPTDWWERIAWPRSRIASSLNRSFSSSISRPARVSIPYRIELRNGLPSASAGRVQAPIPLTETPTTLWPSDRSSSSATIAVKSPHQTPSGSCSMNPGCGKSVSCGRSTVATTEPSGVRDHPL